MINVAINGFGRIGRSAFKIIFDLYLTEITIVAVNDLADAKTLAYLLEHDSNYGLWKGHIVSYVEDMLVIDHHKIKVLSKEDPATLPWNDLKVDVVIESTGKFTRQSKAAAHVKAGAKRVIISAPSKGDDPAPTFVSGVNEYVGQETVINNASCTTNCIAPVMRVLEEAYGVDRALMTTVHAYTQDQMLQDGPHKDLRRTRAAAQNIIPTSTGAAVSTTEAIPQLRGKFDGVSLRVPVSVGSIADITAVLKKEATISEINQLFVEASGKAYNKGILEVTNEPIVSSDIVGSSASAIVDLSLTQAIGNLVKVFAWYDNEWGYSNRLVEQTIKVGKMCQIKQ